MTQPQLLNRITHPSLTLCNDLQSIKRSELSNTAIRLKAGGPEIQGNVAATEDLARRLTECGLQIRGNFDSRSINLSQIRGNFETLLFSTLQFEFNSMDSQFSSMAISESQNTPFRSHFRLRKASQTLLFRFRGGQAIAVIYFRAGYAPTDYPSELAPRRYNKSLQNPMFLRGTSCFFSM